MEYLVKELTLPTSFLAVSSLKQISQACCTAVHSAGVSCLPVFVLAVTTTTIKVA